MAYHTNVEKYCHLKTSIKVNKTDLSVMQFCSRKHKHTASDFGIMLKLVPPNLRTQ